MTDLQQLHAEVQQRFGVLPNFFRLAAKNPQITANLWGFARFAYLDSPLPSLFKERLFVYLSRFCEVRYCIVRHLGFLVGLGRPSGDEHSIVQTVEDALQLLRRRLPRGKDAEPDIARCTSVDAPLAELPPPDSELEESIFTCAAHAFLQTPDAPQCLAALKRAFGEARFEHLMVFLAFVRTAHYWTQIHPELTFEEDVEQLMSAHTALADCLLKDPEADSRDTSQKLIAELEALLRERSPLDKARLAAIVDSSDDAIVSKTLEGVITSWNRGAEKLFGYSAAEAIGKHISLIIPADRISEEDYVIGKVRHGEIVDHFETLRRTKDGRPVDISLTVSPIKDAQGRIIGASKIARDITERKRAEQAVHEHRRQLVEADRLKDEFMAMLAHELRNPLAAIALGADLLKRATLDDAKARFAAPAIERQAKQLQRLADDMLDMARASYGKLTLRKERVDLLQAAKAIAAVHGNGASNAKLKVRGKSAWVDGDSVRLQQMIGNLVDNALKYGGRTITIRVASSGGHSRVAVEDDGQGIAPELLPNLFKPFVQGERQLDRAQGGLGLGLALVDRLTALHGGNIQAHSEGPGKGSAFTISLPAAPGRAAGGERQKPPASAAGKQRILVVEDEKDVREMLKFVLESEGHEVSLADNGVEGLAKLGSFRPDVALVDIGLPGMDGYEVARQARSLAEGKRIRLIALSGYGQDKDREKAHAAGFDLHVTKPVVYEQLAQAFKS